MCGGNLLLFRKGTALVFFDQWSGAWWLNCAHDHRPRVIRTLWLEKTFKIVESNPALPSYH